MIDEIKINDVDVTSYRLNWDITSDFNQAIDVANLSLIYKVEELFTLTKGMSITIKRGFDAVTEDYVFEGQIGVITKDAAKGTIELVCQSRLIDAIKSRKVYSWEYDVDSEGGVGSELVKAHCDNSGLYYDDESIINTGSGSGEIIKKWIQNDEDDFTKMNDLAEIYNYSIRYVPRNTGTGRVFFQPFGYSIYPYTLNVGTQITKQIRWQDDMLELINKIKIQGATVYDKIVETGTGPSFTITKTPEDTELREDNATGTLLTRGQKDVGILGTNFDYYVDVQQKTIFTTGTGLYWIRYGSQVPMPIVLSNATSIEEYGGPNKKPHYKKFVFDDLKDVNDAEKRCRAILDKYSSGFLEAKNIYIANSILQEQFINPGDLITIVDSYNNKNVEVIVKNVKKSFPHVNDIIEVGNRIWATSTWEAAIEKKINLLNAALNKNQDILFSVTDLNNTPTFESRYFKKQSRDITGTGGIWGHPTFGRWDEFYWTDGSNLPAYANNIILQGDNIYKEFFYDDDFEGDTTSGTALWDTTNKRLEIGPGSIYTISNISLGSVFNWFTYNAASITGTGDSITCEGSADSGTTYSALTANNRKQMTITYTSQDDQEQLTRTSSVAIGLTGYEKMAQQFYPKYSILKGLAVNNATNVGGFSEDVRCSLYSDNSGEPGTELAGYTMPFATWDTYRGDTTPTAYFPISYTLDLNKTYWLVIGPVSYVSGSVYGVIYRSTSAITYIGLCKSLSSGTWTTRSYDLVFRTVCDVPNTGVYLKFTNSGSGTGYISNTYTDQDDYDEPAIYLKMEK